MSTSDENMVEGACVPDDELRAEYEALTDDERAELDAMTERTEWAEEPVIGQRASYTTTASWGTATGSGIYLGVALDEEDGVPYHYLADGEVNGHAQSSHGFPATPGTPATTNLTPTGLIRAHHARGVLVLDGVAHEHRESPEGFVICPKCGHHDVALWADDGEADLSDWWQCETFSGGCGAHGAVCPASDITLTQNGVAV